MKCLANEVALLKSDRYEKKTLKSHIESVCRELDFSIKAGQKILLKPNLVSGNGHNGNAVTHPEFVAAVAAWCIDHGGRVAVGDSPAFGSAVTIMKKFGYLEALGGLSVELVNFRKKKHLKTSGGFSVVLAAEIDDYDVVVNLPKIKAHSQLRITMAIKNYFGFVLSWRKAFAHMHHGDKDFARFIIDLLELFPDGGITLADGILAMHKSGPVRGDSFDLSVLAASKNPVALDTAFMHVLGVNPQLSPLMKECCRRKLVGCDAEELIFPLASPPELAVKGFQVPAELSPVRFGVHNFVKNSIKKAFS